MPNAKHLWVGQAEAVLDEVVKRVAPAAYPLPREWDGLMTYGDASTYADRTVAAFDREAIDREPGRRRRPAKRCPGAESQCRGWISGFLIAATMDAPAARRPGQNRGHRSH